MLLWHMTVTECRILDFNDEVFRCNPLHLSFCATINIPNPMPRANFPPSSARGAGFL